MKLIKVKSLQLDQPDKDTISGVVEDIAECEIPEEHEAIVSELFETVEHMVNKAFQWGFYEGNRLIKK